MNPYTYIDIKNAKFPVTTSFDYTTLTQNSCTIGSLLSAMESNALYDAGGYTGNLWHYNSGSILIDTIGQQINLNNSSYMRYEDVDNKTIYTMWLQFGGNDLKTLNLDENSTNKMFFIYPNPFSKSFQINKMNIPTSAIQIVDLQGRKVDFIKKLTSIRLVDC